MHVNFVLFLGKSHGLEFPAAAESGGPMDKEGLDSPLFGPDLPPETTMAATGLKSVSPNSQPHHKRHRFRGLTFLFSPGLLAPGEVSPNPATILRGFSKKGKASQTGFLRKG
jgi:hypothetical protein